MQQNSLRVIDLFLEWDRDGSGRIDRQEFRAAVKQVWPLADTNMSPTPPSDPQP